MALNTEEKRISNEIYDFIFKSSESVQSDSKVAIRNYADKFSVILWQAIVRSVGAEVIFRVSGTILQYSINGGTNWDSIYNLSVLSNTWGSITGTLSDQLDLQSALNAKQNSIGYITENVANKATTFSTINDTLYPSVEAVSEYVTTQLGLQDIEEILLNGNDANGLNINNLYYISVGNSTLNIQNSELRYGAGGATLDWKDLLLTGGEWVVDANPLTTYGIATKNYVDTRIDGLDWKEEVVVRTTANITLSGEQTIDGVLTSASRVLVMAQTNQINNGIYTSAAGAWSRTSDADTGAEIFYATMMIVGGTLYANTQWTCSNSTLPVIGVDNITFAQVAGAGVYTYGTYLKLTGNVFDIDFTTFSTTQITEGSNEYFTNERAQDAVGNAVGIGLEYDDPSGAISVTANIRKGVFGINLDGSAAIIIEMAAYGSVTFPFNCTITGWEIEEVSDPPIASSIVVDVWKDTYANYPPTVADAIFTTKPTLTAAIKNQNLAPTFVGAGATVTAGETARFNVDSNDVAEKVIVTIFLTKT